MSSTDLEKKKALLAEKFFLEMIVPQARSNFFTTQPDPSQSTYFTKPQHNHLRPENFELPASNSLEEFVEALKELWMREGNLDLCQIGDELLKLAKELSKEEKQEEDLPPFIYTMF